MTATLPRSLYMGRKAVYRQGWEVIFIPAYVDTVNPLLTPPPPGGLFYFKPICGGGGGLIGNGGLFNLEKMMVSVLHKELQYNTIWKSSNTRLEIMQPKITMKSELPVRK